MNLFAASIASPAPEPFRGAFADLVVCRACGGFDPSAHSGLCEDCETAALRASRHVEALLAERARLIARAEKGAAIR